MASKKFITAICLLFLFLKVYPQCDGRYLSPVFSDVSINSDIQFGESVTENGTTLQLTMDIYAGEGDVATKRPVLIFCHGGTFYGGTKNDWDMEIFCEDLAKMGYVCASINYRLTSPLNILNPDTMVKTVMRAVQDAKASVRYFRMDADGPNNYNIDPDAIFIGGSSAGGVLALHLAYMDNEALLPAKWQQLAASLGGLEGNSGNPGYSSEVAGVFSYAGALADTNWLKAGDPPFMTTHSENDGTVIYGYGPPVNSFTLPSLYGSAPLKVRADNVGVENDFYSYTGGAHPPHNGNPQVIDSTVAFTARFVYRFLPCNKTNVSVPIVGANDNFTFYPNPATGKIMVSLSNAGKDYNLSIHNSLGQQVLNKDNLSNQNIDLDLSDLSNGLYFIKVTESSDQHVVKKLQIHR